MRPRIHRTTASFKRPPKPYHRKTQHDYIVSAGETQRRQKLAPMIEQFSRLAKGPKCLHIFAFADSDGDGYLSRSEFELMLMTTTRATSLSAREWEQCCERHFSDPNVGITVDGLAMRWQTVGVTHEQLDTWFERLVLHHGSISARQKARIKRRACLPARPIGHDAFRGASYAPRRASERARQAWGEIRPSSADKGPDEERRENGDEHQVGDDSDEKEGVSILQDDGRNES